MQADPQHCGDCRAESNSGTKEERKIMRTYSVAVLFALAVSTQVAGASVLMFGDEDLCNTGTYSSDPTTGATLQDMVQQTSARVRYVVIGDP